MSEAEIIHDAEVIGEQIDPVPVRVPGSPIGTELEPVQHGTLFRTDDPAEMLRRASVMAEQLAAVVRKQKLTSNISGKEHVRVEGWTLLGSMLGVFPVCEWTRETANGWEARVEARTLSGQVVGAAEAQCDRSESTWKNRDGYALRSMAQTRATSKALRQPLGFVMQLAGFDPTPAEEMPRSSETVDKQARVEGPKPLAPPKSWAKLTEMAAQYDQHVHDLFFAFADAARRLEFPDSTDTKSLSKADKDWLFQKCAGAIVVLLDDYPPSSLPFPDIEAVRAAFFQVVGVELAIPEEELDAEAAEAAEREA